MYCNGLKSKSGMKGVKPMFGYISCTDCPDNLSCKSYSGCKHDNDTRICARCLSNGSECLYEPKEEVKHSGEEKNL